MRKNPFPALLFILGAALLVVTSFNMNECGGGGGGGGGGTTVKVNVCEETSLIPAECCPVVVEKEFASGQQPSATCAVHECVSVSVCAETSLVPNEWCPSVVDKRFPRNAVPTATCSVHRIPRLQARLMIFALDLLAGGVGDPLAFIDNVAAAVGPPDGMVYVRVALTSNWKRQWFQPWKEIARWNAGYDIAADARPFYDLAQDDAEWWVAFRALCAKMKENGLGLCATLEDKFAFVGGADKYFSPFCSNVQDRDAGDPMVNRLPGGVWGIGAETIEPYHRAWFRRVVAELNESGVLYILEVTNEYDSIDNAPADMVAWHGNRVQDLIDAGVPKEKIIASAVREGRAIAAQVGAYSIHGFVRPDSLATSYMADLGVENNRLIVSADGGTNGDGRADARGRKGASPAQEYELCRRLLALGYFAREVMDRGQYAQNNDVANYGLWNGEATSAAARALRGL